jgi:hypothetical protein
MTEAMDCNKIWKKMITYNKSSQPEVLKMESSRWIVVAHGGDTIRNEIKCQCRRNKKQDGRDNKM